MRFVMAFLSNYTYHDMADRLISRIQQGRRIS